MNDEVPTGVTTPYAPPREEMAADDSRDTTALHPDAQASGYQARRLIFRTLCGLLLVDALVLGLNFVACALLLSEQLPDQNEALVRFSHLLVSINPALHWIRLIFFGWFLVRSNKNARAFIRTVLATCGSIEWILHDAMIEKMAAALSA